MDLREISFCVRAHVCVVDSHGWWWALMNAVIKLQVLVPWS
jgi:hypothetical protein